ncbi:MAG: V-type ATP synthase subunit I [Candidatus Zixiibacteriota bacterium]
MAVASMKKVGILGYRGKIDEIISGLQDLGMVHLVREKVPEEIFLDKTKNQDDQKGDDKEKEDKQQQYSVKAIGVDIEQSSSTSEVSKKLSRLQQTIDILDDNCAEKIKKKKLDDSELESFAKDYGLDDIIEKAKNLNLDIDNYNRELRIAQRKVLEIKPFKPLRFAPKELDNLSEVSAFIGFAPLGQFIEMEKALSDEFSLYEIQKINEHFSNVYFIGYCHNEIKEKFEDILRLHEFLPIDNEVRYDIPEKVFENHKDEIDKLENKIEKAEKALSELAISELPSLLLIEDYYKSLVQCEEVFEASQKSRSIFYITGWVRQELFDKVYKKLEAKYPETEVLELAPGENENPPVALSNPKWLRPFEILTNMYGKPVRGMVDPTPWTGPFFALFFAFCMTDAGYGLLLALLGAGALTFMKKKLDYGKKNFMTLILYLGVLTIGTGIIAGSYFGFNPASVENPGAFSSFLLKLKIFDPLDDALLFFALTVYFAMIQLVIGYALSAYVKIKGAKNAMLKIKELVLGISWILLTFGISILVTQYIYEPWAAPFDSIMPGVIWFGMGGVVLGFAIFGPLGGEKIVGSVFNAIGFDGLYGITGLFGDILSYARILALGISTGVIGGVINNLGGILAGSSIILTIIAAIVVAASHVGYTALSALSAFIHPLRLQYVEYFGKFYESGGEDFKPFKKNYKNVK